ncbi:hypothetical protein COCNU_05G010330 [Cocos nucifera]|uniref:NmrA-like domain-containing protein n=1 Tax=Cocos nucifera TaxID=13894 RepID=A0A8K0IA35_COCNU|nr:hypothetical protein COCNU_05G010330 [Cocos nucifera]
MAGEMSKILIIGGTGYLGKFIVGASARSGHPTFALRFLPSEFGLDVDRIHAAEPASSVFALKAHIRRAIEAEGIPYTIVCCNCFAGYFLPTLAQPEPPKEKVTILGDGNPIGFRMIIGSI